MKDITDLPVLVVNTHGHLIMRRERILPEVLIHEDDVSLLKKHRGGFTDTATTCLPGRAWTPMNGARTGPSRGNAATP